MSAAAGHLSVDALLDYWLHDDAPAAAVDAVDEHLMQCDACGQVLDELIALGDGVRSAFRAGAVSAVDDVRLRAAAGRPGPAPARVPACRAAAASTAPSRPTTTCSCPTSRRRSKACSASTR